jgi:hypothetical protein
MDYSSASYVLQEMLIKKIVKPESKTPPNGAILYNGGEYEILQYNN